MAEKPPTRKAHCNTCGHETNHEVIAERVEAGSELIQGRFTIEWRNTYAMLQCLGCEAVCLQRTNWFSEEPEDESVTYYPPQVSRRVPKWADSLPYGTKDLLDEVYTALHADSRRLAMMGARALIDVVMTTKVGDAGTFAGRLDALVRDGYVSTRNRDVLAAALDAGSAAAHRGHKASSEEVNQVIDIVENLLQTDLLEAAAVKLKAKTPARPKVGKRAT